MNEWIDRGRRRQRKKEKVKWKLQVDDRKEGQRKWCECDRGRWLQRTSEMDSTSGIPWWVDKIEHKRKHHRHQTKEKKETKPLMIRMYREWLCEWRSHFFPSYSSVQSFFFYLRLNEKLTVSQRKCFFSSTFSPHSIEYFCIKESVWQCIHLTHHWLQVWVRAS